MNQDIFQLMLGKHLLLGPTRTYLLNGVRVLCILGSQSGFPLKNVSINNSMASPPARTITSLSSVPKAISQKSTSRQWNQGSSRAAFSSPWMSIVTAAAAAMATTLAVTSTAFADAMASPNGGSSDLKSALEATKAEISRRWQAIEHDISRFDAQGVNVGKASEPSVSIEGNNLQVVIPVRQGVSPSAVESALMLRFSSGASTKVTVRHNNESRVVNMDIRNRQGGQLHVSYTHPLRSSNAVPQVVLKKNGPFNEEELNGLGDVMTVANLPTGDADPYSGTASGQYGQSYPYQGESHDPLDSFFGGIMGHIFSEMQRTMQEMEGAQGSQDWNNEGQPTIYRTFGGSFPPGQPGTFGPGGSSGQLGPPRRGTEPDYYDWGSPAANQAVKALRGMGAQVFPPGKKEEMDWGILAGYEAQKMAIEDCLLMPLQRPEVFKAVAKGTRVAPGSNRPRAVLFEGPPGTGKTTSARIISSQAAVPLIYVPLEAVLSKWYGESEQLLSKVFKAGEALGGAIIFFDELDSLGTSRDRGDMHEVSRRMLSVLLREMDGFDAEKKVVVIGATNRKMDLDAALLSRFDMAINFGLPDEKCRAAILGQYARQLSNDERMILARRCVGMSGRDLRDVCEATERRWASKIIRGEVKEGALPTLADYEKSAEERIAGMVAGSKALPANFLF